MLKVKYHNLFKKDIKLMKKRGYDISLIKYVIKMLANGEKLPEKYKEHYLTGEFKRI